MKPRERLIFAWLAVLLLTTNPRLVQGQISNIPPIVSIVWPADYCYQVFTFGRPGCFKIKAVASDPDGSITQVQFFSDTYLIGTVTNAPFGLIWHTEASGSRLLKAVAFDNLRASTESSPVLVVYRDLPTGKIFEIASPSNGSVLAAPATFVFSAEQMAACGTSVEFFVGTNSVGVVTQSGPFTATTPLYSLTVTNLTEGHYPLYVRQADHFVGTTSFGAGSCESVMIHVTKLGVISPQTDTGEPVSV